MSVSKNNTELNTHTHNGVEVQTWTHNDVEVYSASKPWVAIALDRTLTSPSVAPVSITSGGSVYFQSASGNVYQVSGAYGITTKNSDGTFFLPTNKCKYMRVRTYNPTGYSHTYVVSGKKNDGTVETIATLKYSSTGNTSVSYGSYKDHTGIDVKGYESIRVYSQDSKANEAGVGYLEFYN